MPLGELAGECAGGIFRILWYFLVEVCFEFVIKVPGYLILKHVFRYDVDPDGWRAGFTGFLFWLVVGIAAYYIYVHSPH